MTQLTLELVESPAPLALPTKRHGAEDGPADWGACQEWYPDTGKRCTGRRIHSVTVTTPTIEGHTMTRIVGFGKTTCTHCETVVVL